MKMDVLEYIKQTIIDKYRIELTVMVQSLPKLN